MGYAYSVAIKLSVANLASQGLRHIAKDMLSLYGVTTSVQTKISALKLAAVGYGLDKMGVGIFHGLEKTVSAATEYTRQLSLMNAAGMSHAEIANSISAAWSTSSQVLTSTAAGNLKQLRELRSVFGTQHMAEAYAILPTVMRTQAVLEGLTGKQNEQIGFQMARVAELRQTGVMTLPFLQRNMNELSRTLMAMGGTLNVNDYLMTLKYAKTAGLSLNDRFVYDFLPTFMQEVKGGGGGFMGNTSTAGTSIMRLYTQIVQGLVKKSAIPVWMEMGLIQPGNVVRNATGNFQVKPGGVAGAQLFAQDPLSWVEKFTPAITAYATRHHLTQLQAITSMGLPQNAAWALSTLMLKDAQFRRDQQLIASTPMPLESYNRLLQTNPQLAQQALDSQWYNVLTVIGSKILPKLVPLMSSFAKDLNLLSTWMQNNPNLTASIVAGLGGIAVSLALIGKVMMSVAIVKFLGLGPKIASMAGTTVTALGSLTKSLGLVTAAAAAGYLVGSEIWKHTLAGNKGGDAVSSVVAHIMAAFGSKTARDAIAANEAYDARMAAGPVPPQARGQIDRGGAPTKYVLSREPTQPVTVQTTVNLDGKKIANVVTRHLANEFRRPQTTSAYFDGTAHLVPAGGVQDY